MLQGDNKITVSPGKEDVTFDKNSVKFKGEISFFHDNLDGHRTFLETKCQDCEIITIDIAETRPCDATLFKIIIVYLTFAKKNGNRVRIITDSNNIICRYLDDMVGKLRNTVLTDYELVFI